MVHLIVLVHGLWGSPAHFDYISAQLALKKGAAIDDGVDNIAGKDVVVFSTSCNQGYFTYDGVDVCGARAAKEIEDEILKINRYSGGKVDKLSVVGYSLGGLISRFAVGLLYKRGFLEDNSIQLMNYTSFCSPHIGVVVLGTRWVARAFNFIGQYAMSTTSRQLFMRDNFERTKLPLILHMTDPKGPYLKALSMFKQRSLYANIVNDHRCEWYTAGIDTIDPFTPGRVPHITGPYIDRCSPIILDITKPLLFDEPASLTTAAAIEREPLIGGTQNKQSFFSSLLTNVTSFATHMYNYAFAIVKATVVIPIWFVAFLVNAALQGAFSARRRRSARKGMSLDEALKGTADSVVDTVYTAILQAQEEEEHNTDLAAESVYSGLHAQIVETGPLQKRAIDSLNTLSWKKYPVHIHKATHAHAAVIVRYPSPKFTEGYIIVDHFIENLIM